MYKVKQVYWTIKATLEWLTPLDVKAFKDKVKLIWA